MDAELLAILILPPLAGLAVAALVWFAVRNLGAVYRVVLRTFFLACAFGVGLFVVHGAVAPIPFLSMLAIPGYIQDMWHVAAVCLAGNWLVALAVYCAVAWMKNRKPKLAPP